MVFEFPKFIVYTIKLQYKIETFRQSLINVFAFLQQDNACDIQYFSYCQQIPKMTKTINSAFEQINKSNIKC